MKRILQAFSAIGALTMLSLPAQAQDLTNQDNCANAGVDVRGGSGSWGWNNGGATTGSEGQNEGNCYKFGSSAVDNDIWFVYEASVTGSVTLNTCSSAGTNTDTKMAAYPNNGCPTDGSSLDCNDDTCGLFSQISFPVTCGETYLIQLGNFPGAAGGSATVTANDSGTPCPTSLGVNDPACNPMPNSTGSAAVMTLNGSGNAGDDIEGTVSNGPPGGFGYYISGPNSGLYIVPPGSMGIICVAGPQFRYTSVPLGHVYQFNGAGDSGAVVGGGANTLPTDGSYAPVPAILSGETRAFQSWYRDGTSSNFSNSTRVTFN